MTKDVENSLPFAGIGPFVAGAGPLTTLFRRLTDRWMGTRKPQALTIDDIRSDGPERQSQPGKFDAASFRSQLEALRDRINAQLGADDLAHLKKIERRGWMASIAGYATIWMFPNPVTPFLLSFGQLTRWLLAHHILHRGYDKVPGVAPRYTSKVFARGRRRFIDWFDWIHPDAWHYEHNILHHYYTGEEKDPDLIERNVQFVREAKVPKIFKYALVAATALTWRFTYYAPNTISVINPERIDKPAGDDKRGALTVRDLFRFGNPHVRKLWTACYLPYGLFHFVVQPLLFLPFGTSVALCVLANKLIAEAMLNVHSFMVIGPNHTGSDLYRFDYHIRNKEEFYAHQVLGSANYHTGGDACDHSQIWLNYQIEHHVFPDIPMLKYQQFQPEIKRICEAHGLPYVQESIFVRFGKMVQVWVGNASMKELKQFPR
ncbi:fatty acid desaturase family protein [Derxia lacustris]|uniref:fatty acid desaturase family protein n=1 Tax=Derxia lacustris TaxID=764842 RepID=UPI001C38DCCE|nr:fatty acid desaturase [Derxia lacustris]